MAVQTRFNYPAIHRTGFIKKEQVPAIGTVLREKEGNIMMTTDDIVYIKPTGHTPLIPGHRYQIYSTSQVDQKVGSSRYKGVKHLVKADLEIIEVNTQYAFGDITSPLIQNPISWFCVISNLIMELFCVSVTYKLLLLSAQISFRNIYRNKQHGPLSVLR